MNISKINGFPIFVGGVLRRSERRASTNLESLSSRISERRSEA